VADGHAGARLAGRRPSVRPGRRRDRAGAGGGAAGAGARDKRHHGGARTADSGSAACTGGIAGSITRSPGGTGCADDGTEHGSRDSCRVGAAAGRTATANVGRTGVDACGGSRDRHLHAPCRPAEDADGHAVSRCEFRWYQFDTRDSRVDR